MPRTTRKERTSPKINDTKMKKRKRTEEEEGDDTSNKRIKVGWLRDIKAVLRSAGSRLSHTDSEQLMQNINNLKNTRDFGTAPERRLRTKRKDISEESNGRFMVNQEVYGEPLTTNFTDEINLIHNDAKPCISSNKETEIHQGLTIEDTEIENDFNKIDKAKDLCEFCTFEEIQCKASGTMIRLENISSRSLVRDPNDDNDDVNTNDGWLEACSTDENPNDCINKCKSEDEIHSNEMSNKNEICKIEDQDEETVFKNSLNFKIIEDDHEFNIPTQQSYIHSNSVKANEEFANENHNRTVENHNRTVENHNHTVENHNHTVENHNHTVENHNHTVENNKRTDESYSFENENSLKQDEAPVFSSGQNVETFKSIAESNYKSDMDWNEVEVPGKDFLFNNSLPTNITDNYWRHQSDSDDSEQNSGSCHGSHDEYDVPFNDSYENLNKMTTPQNNTEMPEFGNAQAYYDSCRGAYVESTALQDSKANSTSKSFKNTWGSIKSLISRVSGQKGNGDTQTSQCEEKVNQPDDDPNS